MDDDAPCMQDEKRMEKLKKRLDELDTIQNNVKLLTELLAHYKPDSGDGEKALMQVRDLIVVNPFIIAVIVVNPFITCIA